ncbi:permease [Acinetobacter sp. MD2(2019)]|uniref:permease n=1 Tax=Acinetobacter sp. MD2(2019) TaxID=2605273 RepID=UPI002D1EF922|nr:permease [Acinetobacter sp. MD2(2019)]MEB3754643.1 permease [Acinetobacter sp. MD2(2019)]
MTLLLPFMAFISGWLLASTQYLDRLRLLFSSVLARFFIPFVIIYNMVYYQAGSLALMAFSFCSALLVYGYFVRVFKDRLLALCASYVNLAWLGFPFALAVFGHEISAAMIALYVGGSVFGNVWAVTAVSTEKQSKLFILKKVLKSPPILALILAAFVRLLNLQSFEQPQWLIQVYQVTKMGMIFTGMSVLGMWLKHTHVSQQDLIHSVKVMIPKVLLGAVICSVTYYGINNAAMNHYIGLMFFLFILPPAANIVALETHYQGTGTSARYIAAGTVVSIFMIAIFAVVWHFIIS